jgi:Gpi18-like mannosyltransferase
MSRVGELTTEQEPLYTLGARDRLAIFLERLDTPLGLGVMFGLALLIRLLIASHIGFKGDLRLFQLWAGRLDNVGPRHFYVTGQFQDYPPGYLYVLWLTGKISAAPGYLLLKLPAMLADLGLAWFAGTLASRIAAPALRERLPVRALVAAGVLFNPAVIALSAGWGQVDSVPAMLVVLTLLLLYTGRPSLGREIASFVSFAVAVAMKPQAGFVLPLLLYALYRRYLHGRTTQQLIDGALSIGLVAVPALLLWSISGLAFGMGPVKLVRFYRHSASVYPVTSANAFNFWGSIAFWRNDSTGANVLRIAGIPALHVGEFLLLAGVVFVIWRVHRAIESGAHEALMLTVGSALVSLLAFTFLTRMHERYMFLALACLAPLVVVRPLRLAYAALSGLFLLNLWYPFSYFNVQWGVRAFHYQPVFDWVFGGFATDTWQKRVWSIAVTLVTLAVTWVALRRVEVSGAEAPKPLAPAAPPAAAPVPRRERPAWPDRWAPRALVGITCAFLFATLRAETKLAWNFNDSALHMQMVRWAGGQIREGRVPLDGWYPYFALGSAHFHHYQSLPHTLTAYAAYITGQSDSRTYLWIQYLMLALWPVVVYIASRLLDWGRWTAASAAAVSPLLVSASGYGYEHGSYIWRGYGVYSQLWAMWTLPLAWGLSWRAVSRGNRYAAAAAAIAFTIAFHFITGYLALLTVAAWVIVLGSRNFPQRVMRGAVVGLGGLVIAAWVLVPLISDAKYVTESAYYTGTIFNDSYGARKELGWLFTGKLFDSGRFPIITLLFFAGFVVCVARARREVRARALLGAFVLSLLLWFGRATWGGLIDVLPGMRDVQIQRFIAGVHLAGILIAGVGLGWVVRTAYEQSLRLAGGRNVLVAGAAPIALAIALLAPAWVERAHYDRWGAVLLHNQQRYDATDGRDLDKLVAIIKKAHDGRAYAGLRGTWGPTFTVGYVHVYAWLADRDVDAIGFTFRTLASLSTDVEASFDENSLAQYQMFNVRYLLLPMNRNPSVPAKLVAVSGPYRLFEVKTSGYFQVVDRAPAIAANRTNLDAATAAFRESNLALRNIYPGIAFAGGPAPPPTFTGPNPPPGRPGQVLTQSNRLQDGVFDATVHANRRAVVLLKASYDPRWTVTVDGVQQKPVMMAPSLVGVEVPPGRHVIDFRYKPYQHYTLLLSIGALSLLGLALFPRRDELRRRLRRRRES